MTTSLVRPRVLAVLVAASFLATASVLVTAAIVRAGVPVTCSLLVSSTSSPVPAETATVFVGEQGQITGSGFSPNTQLEAEVTVNGVSMGLFALMTDGSGGFVLSGTIEPGQEGTLVFTATEPDVCSDSVTVTVLAAPPPSTEGLPDAAMDPLAPASTGSRAEQAFAVLLAGAIAWSAVLEIRYRRRRS